MYLPPCIDLGHIQLPLYIISLSKDKARRKDLECSFAPQIVSSYFEASDLRFSKSDDLDFLIDKPAILKRYNRLLRGGEIGCAHSHQRVYQSILDNDIPFALVLEDDIIPFLPAYISELKKQAEIIDSHKYKSLVCHIGLTWYKATPRQRIIDFSRTFPRFLPNIWSVDMLSTSPLWLSHAYFVTQSAAKGMLKINHKIQYLADDWTAMQRHHAFDYFLITKPVFIPNPSFDSNCQSHNIDSIQYLKSSFFRRFITRLVRELSLFLPWNILFLLK